jgi:hypothetical protein
VVIVGGGDWLLANGAPSVLKSVPDEAVVSLEAIVLLIRFTTNASSRDTPPPLPASAAFPISRLALMTSPGPIPSLSPGTQSLSVTLPHSVATPLTSVLLP